MPIIRDDGKAYRLYFATDTAVIFSLPGDYNPSGKTFSLAVRAVRDIHTPALAEATGTVSGQIVTFNVDTNTQSFADALAAGISQAWLEIYVGEEDVLLQRPVSIEPRAGSLEGQPPAPVVLYYTAAQTDAAISAAIGTHNASAEAHPGTFDALGAANAAVSAHNASSSAHPGTFDAAGTASSAVSAHNEDANSHALLFAEKEDVGTASLAVEAHNENPSAHPGTFDAAGTAAASVSAHNSSAAAHDGRLIPDTTGAVAGASVVYLGGGTVGWSLGDAYVYGIDYDHSVATASSACKKVIWENGSYTTVSDFMQMPAHDFRRCVMDDLANRHVAYYLNPDDSTLKADGTAADLTGGDGDVMVEIKPVYWRIDHYTDSSSHAHTVWLVSNKPFSNAVPHPFFYVSPGGETLRTQYVGAFHSVMCDSDGAALTTNIEATASAAYSTGRKARSVAGAKPYTGMTQATHRTAAAANGAHGTNSLFKQFLFLMMAIDGGTFDTQTGISQGFLFAKVWDYRFTRLSGRTAHFGNHTGSVFYDPEVDGNVGFSDFKIGDVVYCRYQDGDVLGGEADMYAWRHENTVVYTTNESPSNGSTAWADALMEESAGTTSSYATTDAAHQVVAFSYRGIENPYGEVSEFEDGAVADTQDGYLYHTADCDIYSDSTYTTTYRRDNHAWPASGYVKTFDEKTFFAITTGGASNTYLCDYLYSAVSTARVVSRGGNVTHATIGGGAYVGVYYGLSAANAPIGARLAA